MDQKHNTCEFSPEQTRLLVTVSNLVVEVVRVPGPDESVVVSLWRKGHEDAPEPLANTYALFATDLDPCYGCGGVRGHDEGLLCDDCVAKRSEDPCPNN